MLTLAAGCGAASIASILASVAGLTSSADMGWYLSMAACALATAGALGHLACASESVSFSRKFAGGQALPAGRVSSASSSRGQYRMEDFGLMKGTKFGFKDEWGS